VGSREDAEMGNINTGDIYELQEGEKPKLGDVPLSTEQAETLRTLDLEIRKLEMQKIRDQLAQRRPTIGELEDLIEAGVDVHIEPDNTVTISDAPKPITLNKNLGGEYANG
jgi:hypothetical protein